jgi:hypothetical protein
MNVLTSSKSAGFSQGQKVRYRTGSDTTTIYKIKTRSGNGKYTLVTLGDEVANGGMEVDGTDLVEA